MRLTHINVLNVLGIREANLPLHTPVTLFAAANRNGKTSLAEAIRMALTGNASARGLALKKELQALVHDGAKSGSCEVQVDNQTAFILLPSGKSTPLSEWVAPPALPYVLDAQRFASLALNERRAFLFGLMGLKVTPEVVVERLTKRGVDLDKAKLVVPYLRAGFADACKEAKTKATEAKGAWRVVTGEPYGSVKAASWTAARPEVDATAAASTREQIDDIDFQIADANQRLGNLNGAASRASQRANRIAELDEKVETKARAITKLAMDEKQLAEWELKVTMAQGESTPAGIPCPCCGVLLRMEAGALVEAGEVKRNPEADRLAEYTRSRDLMKRSVANDKAALEEINAAEGELKALKTEESEVPQPSDIEDARLKLHELTQSRSTKVALLQKIEQDQRAVAQADADTRKAADHHATVEAWDAIAEALAPDGIPGDMLKEALVPFNTRLEQSALDSEWDQVTIGPDMEISVRTAPDSGSLQRPYHLLSESEKWRVDAMLTEAVSFLSGVKLLMLDRFDVLDIQGRADLLSWLDVLAEAGDIHTALLFGTLKQPPSQLPASITSVWIEAGVARLPHEALAA